MARATAEGKIKVAWIPGEAAVANIEAPTVAEIGTGTQLSPFTTRTGVQITFNGQLVDSATIDDLFDAQIAGTWGGEAELTMFRDFPADIAWNLFDHGDLGFLVVGRNGSNSVAADKVEVYPVQAMQPLPVAPAANEQQTFTVKFAIRLQPALKATVAAAV